MEKKQAKSKTPYKWQVTKALDPDFLDEVGVHGPRRCTAQAVTSENAQRQGWNYARWRMRDDDRTLYVEGAIMWSPKYEGFDGFEPLDELGMPRYGCTIIEYWEEKSGRWQWVIL